MKIFSDNHMHTYRSGENGHAQGSIEDLVLEAKKKGLKEIIVSEHGPGHSFYGIKRSLLKKQREDIDQINKKYPEVRTLMGMEANVMSYDGRIDLDLEEIELLDRLSVGFHYGILPKDIKGFFIFLILNPLSKVIKPLEKYVVKESTDALIKILENYPINIITHPGSKVKLDLERLAPICEEKGVALEVNSHHSRLSQDDLILLKDKKVMFSLGSDAHRPRRVGDLEKAIERLEGTGIGKDRLINL